MRSGSKGNDWTSLAVRHRPQSCAQVPLRFWRFLLSPLLSPRPVTCLLARPHPNRLSLNALAGTGGLFQPICSTQQQTLREHRWGERTNGDLISRNPSLWEVRNHTLLPANTLAKVSQRDLLVPSFNSTAAKDTEMHPHGPLHTHSPSLLLTRAHTHAHAHKAAIAESTHRISKSRSARKAPSSMQLMWLLSSCLWESKGTA